MKKYMVVVFLFAALFVCTVFFAADSAQGDYFEIVKNMGYTDVETSPSEIVEFTVPAQFNAVYERYNNLLKEEGYDLSPYKGKTCTRYTYLIPSLNARANIIVHGDEVIGGDISGITIDGIMIPIKG